MAALDECTCWSTSVLNKWSPNLVFIDWLCGRSVLHSGGAVAVRLGVAVVAGCCRFPLLALDAYLLEHLGFEQLGHQPVFTEWCRFSSHSGGCL